MTVTRRVSPNQIPPMKASTKIVLLLLLNCLMVAALFIPGKCGATVSGATSSSFTLTLPATMTSFQLVDGKDWNPKTGEIKWVPAAAEIKP